MLLGQHLRRLREDKSIHSEDAAVEVGVARATLWRMEKGDARCRYKPGDVERLARLSGADTDLIETLLRLAKATRRRGWLMSYRDLLPDTMATAIELEGYAVRVRCYADALVPDLLQIEDYATAQLKSSRMSAIDVRRP
jgi:transcriptional regulator with XRE-family HTH domain